MTVRGYTVAGSGQVHFRRAGRAGPELVLLHETPLSSAVFEPALPRLAAWARPFALDTPGYGMSDPPAAPLHLPGYAALLGQAIRSLAAGPVVVAGVHTGASLAVELARQIPELVAGVVVVGLPAYPPAERERLARTFAPPLAPREDGAHLARAWRHYQRIWPDAPVADRHRAVVAMLAGGHRYDWAYLAVFRYDPVPVLRSLTCPVLAMAAERERLRPATERVAAELGLPFMVVAGAGGQLPATRPAEFSQALREFAGRIEPGARAGVR